MKYDFAKRKLKAKMSWNELVKYLDECRRDPEFMKALKQFMKETTS